MVPTEEYTQPVGFIGSVSSQNYLDNLDTEPPTSKRFKPATDEGSMGYIQPRGLVRPVPFHPGYVGYRYSIHTRK